MSSTPTRFARTAVMSQHSAAVTWLSVSLRPTSNSRSRQCVVASNGPALWQLFRGLSSSVEKNPSAVDATNCWRTAFAPTERNGEDAIATEALPRNPRSERGSLQRNDPNARQSETIPQPSTTTKTTTTTIPHRVLAMDPSHFQPLGSWTAQQLAESRAQHPYIMTWIPGKQRHQVPIMTHGKGVYLYDIHGKQYLDWTSQAVCTNLGYTIPEQVMQAAWHQLSTLPFTYGGIGITEVRIRLNQLLTELLSSYAVNEDESRLLRPAVYPSSGSEANEAAFLLARRYTGRHKVLSFYRSYHGASAHAASASGDYRRWYGKEHCTGFVKILNPFSLLFPNANNNEKPQKISTLSHIDAATEEGLIKSALDLLEEQIMNEGPEQIASLVMESIVGPGGCLILPTKYMQGVRALCDKYGILLHMDEIMVGFGRTGRLFGFEHYDQVVPDILVAGKGLTGAAIPLSLTACSTKIIHYFEEHPLGWGATYQAHPVALAVAYETIKYMVHNNVVGHVQDTLAPILARGLGRLANKYDCIEHVRSIGLFGCFDVQDVHGKNPKPWPHKPAHNERAFLEYKKSYAQAGLVGLHRYPQIHSAPPLIIAPHELEDGLDRLDQALHVLNQELGHS
ncbi:hypothetical protein ACA910_004420 [Epithemia clementina (nom. ined.)]